MKLRAYRELKKLRQTDVAEQLGTSDVNVCRWEAGVMIPRRKMIEKIRVWSSGAVTPADFYEVPGV